MGRKKFSELPPDIAAKYKADLSEKKREAWKKRSENGYSSRVNGVYNEGVSQSISESVKKRWVEGAYKERINGMVSRTGKNHPNWTWGKEHYNEILSQYEEIICVFCGKLGKDEKLDVHHIDENHNNYLLSNLQWVCVPCHLWNYHYTDRGTHIKQPFVSVSKIFDFEYAHVLPWHPGKCAKLHGHSGVIEVEIRKRLNPLGIVEDFYDISRIVKMSVIEIYDHVFLNDFIENPTAENIILDAWIRLEDAGLKGLESIKFSETRSSSVTITKSSIYEAFGWDKNKEEEWFFIKKEVQSQPNLFPIGNSI